MSRWNRRNRGNGQTDGRHRQNGKTQRLNVAEVVRAPETAEEERSQFPGFTRHAEPWHRGIFQELYPTFFKLNAALFKSVLKSPHLMIGMTAPRVLGFCKRTTDYGAQMQITFRPSLFDGSHSAVYRSWYESVGVKRFVNDILLHEMVHQFHFEVTGNTEPKRRGHGKYFTKECNRISRDHFVDEDKWIDDSVADVLDRDGNFGPRIRVDQEQKRDWQVYTQRRGATDAHKRLAKYWPHTIRPEGYYGPDVQVSRWVAGKKPKHVPMWVLMFENIVSYIESGRGQEVVQDLKHELRKMRNADCEGCVESWASLLNEPVCRLDALKTRGLPPMWLGQLPNLLQPEPTDGEFM